MGKGKVNEGHPNVLIHFTDFLLFDTIVLTVWTLKTHRRVLTVCFISVRKGNCHKCYVNKMKTEEIISIFRVREGRVRILRLYVG